MEAFSPLTLRAAAEGYVAELNQLRPEQANQRLAEVAAESPYWDDRSNLFSLVATDPRDRALVLTDGTEELVVRYATDRWVVDDTPVDWDALEAEALLDEEEGYAEEEEEENEDTAFYETLDEP